MEKVKVTKIKLTDGYAGQIAAAIFAAVEGCAGVVVIVVTRDKSDRAAMHAGNTAGLREALHLTMGDVHDRRH